MSLKNPKLFGLNVDSKFADVPDEQAALKVLNLSPTDLSVIAGSSNAGTTRGDWLSLSRLSDPLFKTLDRYVSDSNLYASLLATRPSVDSTLLGNLRINGGLSGSAIRYRYVDGTGPSAVIKIADISTSRVSAWSSSASPVLNTSPISYGARVGIITGGSLQFGTQSPSVTGPRLKTTLVPQPKEFNSEFPTHKINCSIGGNTVTLYVMKGIPLVFTGFFRDLNASVTLSSLINNTPASWKIVEVSNSNSFSRFSNIGGNTSTINYRSSSSRERYIQLYYNPDNVSSITINDASISSIPEAKFSNLTNLNLLRNNLKRFPDLTFVAPNIQKLYFGSNPFYLSDITTERSLNSNIIAKIPSGLKELHLGATFNGSIGVNLIGNKFTELQVLNLSRSSGPSFYPDTSNPSAPLPNVPDTCQTYNVANNDFRTIGSSSGSSLNIKELTNLITLELSGNYNLTNSLFSISASNTKIQYINISSTNLPCPNLSGRQSLTTFYGNSCRSIGSIFDSGTYKFDGCGSLSTLQISNSPLTGAMPKFTNASLTYLDLRYTALTGGNPNGDNTYVIPEKTFEICKNLQYFIIQSGNLLTTPIHPSAFSYTPNIYYILYISNGRTTGSLPSFSSCSRLTYLIMPSNRFSGVCPNLASNPGMYYVDLSYNLLSGNIPAFKNLGSLYYLYLYNNQFTGISKFQNLPNLSYFYAHNNRISGSIPDFGDCPNLFYLVLFNNRFTNYTVGALSRNYRLRYLDLSNNLLTQQSLNALINDLYINYTSVNRGGVTINIRGNTTLPSELALEQIAFLRTKGWSITYQ